MRRTTPFYIRVVRLGRARFRREVNEVMEIDGQIVDLDRAYFDHFPFSKGLTHWVERHNSYSSGRGEDRGGQCLRP